jgi:hypothetical protein
MADSLELTLPLCDMLERIAAHSGSLLMLAVTASGRSEENKLNKLRGAGYAVKCAHPTVKDRLGDWPAEALAITEAGVNALKEASSRPATTANRPVNRGHPSL